MINKIYKFLLTNNSISRSFLSIKEILRKKESWEKIDISPLIKNRVLLLNVPYKFEHFTRVCKRSSDQKIEFDKILMTYDCYEGLHKELMQYVPADSSSLLFTGPLTKIGHQTLEGIKNPITGNVVQVFTIKPNKYIKVN